MEVATGRVALHFIGCGAGINAKAARSCQAIDSSASAVDPSEIPASIDTFKNVNYRASSTWEAATAFRFWNFAWALWASFAATQKVSANIYT
ncbi:MAG: hypothetical protein VXW42_03190 [Planctomycetota bacterium]|nr:hypothetical protein [Planctomycetota bacterium]